MIHSLTTPAGRRLSGGSGIVWSPFLVVFSLLIGPLPRLAPGELATPLAISLDTRPRLESRAANSVDTATGAFVLDLNVVTLQGSRIPLEFNLSYNSMLADDPLVVSDRLFGGWGHLYDVWLEHTGSSTGSFIGADDVVTVRRNGNLRSRFKHIGTADGRPFFEPIDGYNLHDKLDLLDERDGDLNGLWRLQLSDGTTYLLHPKTGRLMALFNRNGIPIHFEYTHVQSYGRDLLTKISTVSKGFRTSGPTGDGLEISASLILCYRPRYGPDIDGGLNAIVQNGDTERDSLHTHVVISEGTQRLERIYDPVTLELMGQHRENVTVPAGQTVEYPVNVPFSATDRLIRITPDIDLGFGFVKLVSPSGRSVKVHYNEPLYDEDGNLDTETKFVPEGFFTDRFLGENPEGEWKLVVDNQSALGEVATIHGIVLERARQSANWIAYGYAGNSNRLVSCTDSKGNLIYSNAYDANGRVVHQTDGRGHSRKIAYEDIGEGWTPTSTPGSRHADLPCIGILVHSILERSPILSEI